MAEHVKIEELVSKVRERKLDESSTLEKVKKAFNDGDDIKLLSLQLSLRCPLSQGRITIPAKGKNCNHIQCFDLTSYLSMNRNIPKFKCPVCNKSLPFSDLALDSYVERILQETPINVEEIEIKTDFKWSIPEMKTPTKRSASSSGDDEPPAKRQETTPPPPLIQQQHHQTKLQVVDLT